MKRHGNLFSKIVSIDNIFLAYKNSRKGKTKYKEIIEVDKDPMKYCLEIERLLLFGEFKSSKYTMFVKNDKGKSREIFKLPYFPDRIIQHAIMQVIEPIWKKTLISDTYQAIRGRGVHKCFRKIRNSIQVDKKPYCLQVDVSKFYPSIDNEILKCVIRRKIKCKDTLSLLDEIIDGHVGVPIGNYISQYLGNIFLSELDHLIKERYRVKYYYRYCDDIIILGDSKDDLHTLLGILNDWLHKHKLRIKNNYQIFKINSVRGVDCFGYVVRPLSVRVRKSIKSSFLSKLDGCGENSKLRCLPAYYGWLKESNSIGLWNIATGCMTFREAMIKFKRNKND